jgi:hypothetical protein
MAMRAGSLLLYLPSPSLRRGVVFAFVVLTFALALLASGADVAAAEVSTTIDPFRWR